MNELKNQRASKTDIIQSIREANPRDLHVIGPLTTKDLAATTSLLKKEASTASYLTLIVLKN